MRIIGHVESEKQAFIFYSFLLEKGIHSTYETTVDEEQKKPRVSIWIYEEDEVDRAIQYLEEFKANPQDPQFARVEFPQAPPQPPDFLAEQKEKGAKQKAQQIDASWKNPASKKKKSHPFTNCIILVCVMLYFWNSMNQVQMFKRGGVLAIQLGFTSIQQGLMFDYPLANQKIDALLQQYSLKPYKTLEDVPQSERAEFAAAANTPTWKGGMAFMVNWLKKKKNDASIEGPLFAKIADGQIWRLFTPCLLHGSLLHILFNMAWVWILMRQVEERLPKWKILILIILIGVIANIAQYFMSGPYFLGFSGIVCGLVGFIWVRQKMAPWEGYPLQRIAIIFVLVYVVAMFGLEIFSLIKTVYSAEESTLIIANTAHIVGGICGALLGRVPFFSRGLLR